MQGTLTNQNGKASYTAPKLVIYGEFAGLTASATGSVAEAGAAPSNNVKQLA